MPRPRRSLAEGDRPGPDNTIGELPMRPALVTVRTGNPRHQQTELVWGWRNIWLSACTGGLWRRMYKLIRGTPVRSHHVPGSRLRGAPALWLVGSPSVDRRSRTDRFAPDLDCWPMCCHETARDRGFSIRGNVRSTFSAGTKESSPPGAPDSTVLECEYLPHTARAGNASSLC